MNRLELFSGSASPLSSYSKLLDPCRKSSAAKSGFSDVVSFTLLATASPKHFDPKLGCLNYFRDLLDPYRFYNTVPDSLKVKFLE